MSNSKLVTYKRLSSNYTPMANKKITHIVLHHMAGNLSVEQCGTVFASPTRQASAQYGVNGKKVGQYVDEGNRAWTTSAWEIDSKAVTIEVANSSSAPEWKVSDESLRTTIKLCADICKRNGIKRLNYTGDTSGNLHMHKWYAATACPGSYLAKQFGHIADEVNKLLKAGMTTEPVSKTKKTVAGNGNAKAIKTGKVRTGNDRLNIRTGNGTDYLKIGSLANGKSVKIYEVKKGWYRIGKGQWVSADYVGITKSKLPKAAAEPKKVKKSNSAIAKEVISGKWGNGVARAARLRGAGYDPKKIQDIVNRIMVRMK